MEHSTSMQSGTANRDAADGGRDELSATFVELTRLALRGADPVDVFMRICERAVNLLPSAAAGVLVRDPAGVLRVVGSSSASARMLDLLQVQSDEGPSLECVTAGRVVSVRAVETAERWPRFAEILVSEGFDAVHAFPIASRGVTLGALNVFSHGALTTERIEIAEALADIAALILLQIDVSEDAMVVLRRLASSVQAQAAIGQAIGVLAQRFTLEPDAALRLLATTADEHGVTLVRLAIAVVGRDPQSSAASSLVSREDPVAR